MAEEALRSNIDYVTFLPSKDGRGQSRSFIRPAPETTPPCTTGATISSQGLSMSRTDRLLRFSDRRWPRPATIQSCVNPIVSVRRIRYSGMAGVGCQRAVKTSHSGPRRTTALPFPPPQFPSPFVDDGPDGSHRALLQVGIPQGLPRSTGDVDSRQFGARPTPFPERSRWPRPHKQKQIPPPNWASRPASRLFQNDFTHRQQCKRRRIAGGRCGPAGCGEPRHRNAADSRPFENDGIIVK